MKRKLLFIFFAVAVLLDLLFYLVMSYRYRGDCEDYLRSVTSSAKVKVESSIDTYNLVSEVVFNEVVWNDYVLELLFRVKNNPEQKDTARARLYRKLEKSYGRLRNIGIRQLHFHLPNNDSFLRFHRPNKYGDNLSSVRYSVRMANLLHRKYKGFEEGRIYNGFRYVFPLSYQGDHVGTVETSFSFGAVKKELASHGVSSVAFLIRKDIVDEKVFNSESGNYVLSNLSDHYVHERKFLQYSNNDSLCYFVDKSLASRFAHFDTFENDFSLSSRLNDTLLYVVSFIRLKNVAGEPVALFAVYEKDSTLLVYAKRFYVILIAGLAILPLLCLLVFLNVRKALLLRDQNAMLHESRAMLKKANSLLKQKAGELKVQNKKLNDLDATKNKFFSILAHDLKNPFSSIKGLAEIMESEYTQGRVEKGQEFANLIAQTAHQGYQLLENLLQWSRVQTGHMKFEPMVFNLLALVNDVAMLHTAQKEKKGIELTVDVNADITIDGDMFMIETVVRNLVSNALKYTPRGGKISVSAQSDDQGNVIVAVADTGVGLSDDDKNRLFRVDSTFSSPGTDDETGTGLGLVLCKEFIAIHRGEIWAESNDGGGSVFLFKVPAVRKKATLE